MNTRLPGILFYGNCQAQGFGGHCRHLPFLTERFSLHFLRSFGLDPMAAEQILADIPMDSIVLVMEQVQAGHEMPDWIASRIRPGVPRLRFTPLDTNLLWPLRFDDPRNHPEPGFDFGRYPYGDRLVVEVLKRGLTGAEAFAAYSAESPGRLPDLNRLAAMEATRLQAREAATEVKAADIVLHNLRLRPLFWTFNHPAGWLFQQVACRMLDKMRHLLRLSYDPATLAQRWGNFEPLAHLQIPIHPEVARRLDLRWCTPGRVYLCLDGQMRDFDSYMRGYIDFA